MAKQDSLARFDTVSSSIVVIQTYDAKGSKVGLGSGVVLASDMIATNYHVIEQATKIQVMHWGKKYSAKLRYSDKDLDVCILNVRGISAPTVVIGSTSGLKVGERVYTIGALQKLELTMSEGIIYHLRTVEGGQFMYISSPILPASNGGGLFDEGNRLIGLPTSHLAEGEQFNFAVPVEWISELPKRQEETAKSEQATTIDRVINTMVLNEKKDWAGLLAYSLRWTKAHPKEGAGWSTLGTVYANLGQTAKAVDSYQQALRINPEDAEAWYNLGIALLRSGRATKAIEGFQQVLRINPKDAKAWHNLGAVYHLSCQIAKAIDSYQQALRINPEDADVWFNLGRAYRESGHTEKRIDSYQRALRINPEDAEAWSNLGAAYGQSHQPAKSVEALQEALRINPEAAYAWYNLGMAYRQSGQTANSIKAFQQAVRIKPEDAEAWFVLGSLYRESGQIDKTMKVYNRLKLLNAARAKEFFNKLMEQAEEDSS